MENLNLPYHIAIIMDGNGRWGLKNENSRTSGHKEGVKTLEKIIEACIKYDIKILTVYAFSTENWSRPKYEVDTLMWLFKKYLSSEKEKMNNDQTSVDVVIPSYRPDEKFSRLVKKLQEQELSYRLS